MGRPLDGGRAWRVSADNVPVTHPRISPDGTTVAWTSTRDGAPEVHIAPVDGGPPDASPTGAVRGPRCAAGPQRDRCSPSARSGRPHCAAAGPAPSRSTAAPRPPCRTGPSATSRTAAPASSCCPLPWGARRPGGSATAAVRRASCGSTGTPRGKRPASSYASTRTWTGTSSTRPGWESASRSSPTTKASGRCTPPSRTARTCAGTPRSTASTPGTRPPTAPASSTPRPVSCGSSTTSTGPSRDASTSGSADSAPTSSRTP